MRLAAAFFFVLLMVLSVSVPLLEHLVGDDFFALTEVSSNLLEEEQHTKKEAGKQKEVFTCPGLPDVSLPASTLKLPKKTSFRHDDALVSELYASLPEVPPEV